MPNQNEWIHSFFGGDTDFYGKWGKLIVTDGEAEAEQVVKLLHLEPGAHILDWCGGWGRHALPLAKMGFNVSLLDFSKEYLEMAKNRARQENLKLNLIHSDFRKTPSNIQADACINMFTAGLGYLREEDDATALKSLHTALKPGAKFLIDTANLFHISRNFASTSWKCSADNKKRLLQKREFLFWDSRMRNTFIHQDTETGKEETREIEHRIFSPETLVKMLEAAGFFVRSIHGGFDGSSFDFNSKRLVVISEKPKEGKCRI